MVEKHRSDGTRAFGGPKSLTMKHMKTMKKEASRSADRLHVLHSWSP